MIAFCYTTGRPFALSDIQDGTSNTIAFGEWKTGTGNNSVVTIPTDVIFDNQFPPGVARNVPQMSMPAGSGPFLQWLNTCATGASNLSYRNATHTPFLGEGWSFGIAGYTLGNTLLPPNAKYPNCNTSCATLQSPSMVGLSSFHPCGANVLMCDGSVHFLKDSTNMMTIWALGSRAQGEIIDASSY